MAEYIKREAVHDLVQSLTKYAWASPDNTGHRVTVDADDVNFGVDKIPSADVAPVRHGRWVKEPPYISVGGEYKKALICSQCHSFFVSDGNTPWQMHNYCPNCGADMRGINDE